MNTMSEIRRYEHFSYFIYSMNTSIDAQIQRFDYSWRNVLNVPFHVFLVIDLRLRKAEKPTTHLSYFKERVSDVRVGNDVLYNSCGSELLSLFVKSQLSSGQH